MVEEQDKTDVDPLDVTRWRFFVVPVRMLPERSAKSVLTLSAVKALVGEGVGYDDIAVAVREAVQGR